MTINPTPESKFHDVITSFITLYRTSIKDLLEMDSAKRKELIKQMRMICHWLHVMEEIAVDTENERA
jgi:hypothetical protein